MKLLPLSVCIASSCFHRCNRFLPTTTVGTTIGTHTRMTSTAGTGSSSCSGTNTPRQLEVEQKFGLSDLQDVEDRLTRSCFVQAKKVDMVDWYFDVVLHEKQYPLIRQDCWLRYRQYKQNATEGQWELKRGDQGKNNSSRATVYEEIEGMEALLEAQQVVDAFEGPYLHNMSPPASLFAPDDIPQPPIAIPGLVPLARLGTQRSSWKSNDQQGLVVDLDTTDFGHAVGEVEILCDGENSQQVEDAQARLQEWVDTVLGEAAVSSRPPPVGKLEYYLLTKRPDVYQVLVQAGLLPDHTARIDASTDTDSKVLDLHTVHQLIDEQYNLTIAFCNAQTSLLNATKNNQSVSNRRSDCLPSLLDEYDSSIRRVQANLKRLQEVENIMKEIPEYQGVYKTAFKPHVDRTRRVLETVQRAGGGVWSSMGIPLTENDSETVTVGLATLRASVDSVKESLSVYRHD